MGAEKSLRPQANSHWICGFRESWQSSQQSRVGDGQFHPPIGFSVLEEYHENDKEQHVGVSETLQNEDQGGLQRHPNEEKK